MKYVKTEAGQLAFKQRDPSISARQRSLFILFDGNKTVEQVLAATAGMGVSAQDVEALVQSGFLAQVAEPETKSAVKPATAASGTLPSAPSAGTPSRQDQERYLQSKALATQITSSLGLRGFRLNLAVEGAANLAELQELLPKIQAAAGVDTCKVLEAALKG